MSLLKTIRFATFALVFGLAMPLNLVLAAPNDYVPPTTIPPNCPAGTPGCDVPIHTGAAAQEKVGALTLDNILAVFGRLGAFGGSIFSGVGQVASSTYPGSVDLTAVVKGNVGADKYCDRNGQNCATAPFGAGFWAVDTDPGAAGNIKNTNTGKVVAKNGLRVVGKGGPSSAFSIRQNNFSDGTNDLGYDFDINPSGNGSLDIYTVNGGSSNNPTRNQAISINRQNGNVYMGSTPNTTDPVDMKLNTASLRVDGPARFASDVLIARGVPASTALGGPAANLKIAGGDVTVVGETVSGSASAKIGGRLAVGTTDTTGHVFKVITGDEGALIVDKTTSPSAGAFIGRMGNAGEFASSYANAAPVISSGVSQGSVTLSGAAHGENGVGVQGSSDASTGVNETYGGRFVGAIGALARGSKFGIFATNKANVWNMPDAFGKNYPIADLANSDPLSNDDTFAGYFLGKVRISDRTDNGAGWGAEIARDGNGVEGYSFAGSPSPVGALVAVSGSSHGENGIGVQGSSDSSVGMNQTYGGKFVGAIGSFSRGSKVGLYATNKQSVDLNSASDPGWYASPAVLSGASLAAYFDGPVGIEGGLSTINLTVTGGSPGAGKVLTSDATGNATWQTPGGSSQWVSSGGNISTTNTGTVNIGGGSIAGNLMLSNGRIDTTRADGLYLLYGNPTTNIDFQNGKVLFKGNGNVGLGTTNPGQKLEVNGGIRLNPTSVAKPGCSTAANGGTFWYGAGGAGVKDTVEVCAKDAAGNYAWRVIY